MSMLDSLRSKLGIDPDADSYVDDTEENVFPGGQGAAAAQEYTQQQEIKHQEAVIEKLKSLRILLTASLCMF